MGILLRKTDASTKFGYCGGQVVSVLNPTIRVQIQLKPWPGQAHLKNWLLSFMDQLYYLS